MYACVLSSVVGATCVVTYRAAKGYDIEMASNPSMHTCTHARQMDWDPFDRGS